MRVLIDPSGQDLRNMGDVAMCQVAVTRIRELWPTATIQVLTDAPHRLAAYCPGVDPVLVEGRRAWCGGRSLLGGLDRLLPAGLRRRGQRIERAFKRRCPELAGALHRGRMVLGDDGSQAAASFLRAIWQSDLFIVSGQGTVTDAFRSGATAILDTLALASRKGTPTAMLGQGIGPIRHRELLARAKEVLPRVDLIALREGRAAPVLLQSLGVESEKTRVTGDDAIELAYAARCDSPGSAIGVNLRVAPYAGVDHHLAEALSSIFQTAARQYRACLLPIPIRQQPDDRADIKVIHQLLKGSDGEASETSTLDSPLKVIRQAARCRVVVTGSYHAAVFALAQGVPAIGLVNSDYYEDKFFGLAHQFGVGCEVVHLDGNDLSQRVLGAIDRVWRSADQIRHQLLDAARRQIHQSRSAYEKLRALTA
jgi:colanic acid/amylovoran biosynthesis protein